MNSTNECKNASSVSDYYRKLILLSTGSEALFSVVTAALAVIVVTCILGYCKYFVYRLAVYQVLSSLFTSASVALVLAERDEKTVYFNVICQAEAFLLEYTNWVKTLFTLCLSIHLFIYTVYLKNLQRLEYLYIVISLCLPLLQAWVPFIHHNYGLAGAWCFIKSWKDNCAQEKDDEGIIEQFALYFGPMMACVVVCIILCFTTIFVMVKRLHSFSSDHEQLLIESNENVTKKEALKQIIPLLLYPALYSVLMIVSTGRRIHDAVSSDSSNIVIWISGLMGGASYGFLNAILLFCHIAYVYFKKKRKSSSSLRSGSDSKPTVSQSDKVRTPSYTYCSVYTTTVATENNTSLQKE